MLYPLLRNPLRGVIVTTRTKTIQEHIQMAREVPRRSDEEFASGEVLQASEKLWGAASQAVMAAGKQRGWDSGKSHHRKVVVRRLYEESGDELLWGGYTAAETFHANFYHDFMEDYQIEENRPFGKGLSPADFFVGGRPGQRLTTCAECGSMARVLPRPGSGAALPPMPGLRGW